MARWINSRTKQFASAAAIPGLIPVMFFFVAAALASMGPGNIASAALIAPIAMAVGGRAGIPAFLMAIMVGNGANAGSLSPFAPTGIIVSGLMAKIGMFGLGWQIFLDEPRGACFRGVRRLTALFGGIASASFRPSPESEVPWPCRILVHSRGTTGSLSP